MDQLEKVKTGLECCAVGAECDHCPYSQINDGKGDFTGCHQLHWDALELLKEQQPKNGKWVGINEYVYHLEQETGERYCVSAYYDGDLFCNQCWTAHRKTKYNFCPNCGADMRGEQE